MKHALRSATAILACLAFAACADDDAPHPSLYCPLVSRVQQLSDLTVFLPTREDVTAEITHAQITGVAGSCDLEPKKHAVLVKFRIGFEASNGPADQSAPVELPYFVSITDGQTIISKVPYKIVVAFDGNVTSAAATSKPVTVELPNVKETADAQILVGFQLSPEQLAYAADHPAP